MASLWLLFNVVYILCSKSQMEEMLSIFIIFYNVLSVLLQVRKVKVLQFEHFVFTLYGSRHRKKQLSLHVDICLTTVKKISQLITFTVSFYTLKKYIYWQKLNVFYFLFLFFCFLHLLEKLFDRRSTTQGDCTSVASPRFGCE